MEIKVVDFWAVTPCSDEVEYRRFGGRMSTSYPHSLQPEYGGSITTQHMTNRVMCYAV